MNERFWELLTGYYCSRLSQDEKIEMERLLMEYPDSWFKTGLLQQIRWELKPVLDNHDKEYIADRVLQKGYSRERKFRRTRKISCLKGEKRRNTGRVAAAMAICFVAILSIALIIKRPGASKEAKDWQRIVTADGMRSMLHLPDGSEVWLNAGSTLRYNNNFNKKNRKVYLKGEAYFIVKHNADKPFIVDAAEMKIKVLGTEFDVKAYPDENFSEASLIKGLVEVIIKHDGQSQQIYLKPNQKVMVKNELSYVSGTKDTNTAKLKTLQQKESISRDVMLLPLITVNHIIPETAWKENIVVFEDESLSSLTQRLDRWYGVHIIIEDSALAQQHFTGRADNVSLDKLLKILQMIKPFHYAIRDKEVIIK